MSLWPQLEKRSQFHKFNNENDKSKNAITITIEIEGKNALHSCIGAQWFVLSITHTCHFDSWWKWNAWINIYSSTYQTHDWNWMDLVGIFRLFLKLFEFLSLDFFFSNFESEFLLILAMKYGWNSISKYKQLAIIVIEIDIWLWKVYFICLFHSPFFILGKKIFTFSQVIHFFIKSVYQ